MFLEIFDLALAPSHGTTVSPQLSMWFRRKKRKTKVYDPKKFEQSAPHMTDRPQPNARNWQKLFTKHSGKNAGLLVDLGHFQIDLS